MSIPIEFTQLGLGTFLVLTSGFQIIGGILSYLFLTKLHRQESKIMIAGLMLMLLLVFYSFHFIAKEWDTLLIFFLGLGGMYALHSFLIKKSHASAGMAIFTMIGVHEVIEGLFLGGAFLLDVKIGLMSGLIIALHEIPEGMITGMPFFIERRAKIGFFLIVLSQMLYVLAGLFLDFLPLDKSSLHALDSFLIGGVAALSIAEFSMINRLSSGGRYGESGKRSE